jgi:Bifunctional DNA primase/polymerase, N-terminal/AAA domain
VAAGEARPGEGLNVTATYQAALEYIRAGWMPTPLVSKVPVLKDWPTRVLSEADAYGLWGEGKYDGIGIICGSQSGQLLVIDIECRMATDRERMAAVFQAATEAGVGPLVAAAATQASASTPSGGRHLFLRCIDGPVPGNVKLCYARDEQGRDSLLAEVRGQGGQVAAPPALNREWLGTSGPGMAIPVTSVQLGLILDAFRSIDEATRLPALAPRQHQSTSTFDQPRSATVASALNDALMHGEMTWADVLDPGWTCSGRDRQHGYSLWLRPDYGDKSTALSSAHGFESAHDPRPVFVVHSNSVRTLPTGEGQRLTPGRVLAYSWFDGSERDAYAALEAAVTGGEIHPAIARIPTKALERVVEVVASKLPKPAPAPPALAAPSAPAAPAAPTATPGEVPPSEGEVAQRTTWWPRDLSDAIAGHFSEPPPALLQRTDGVSMFYMGKVNGLIGESESGKSWVAQATVAEVLASGHRALYLDFEDTANGIVGRLRSLGTTDEQLMLLSYVQPDESFGLAQAADIGELLETANFTLVILDGVNAAFSLMGFKINENDDASKFYQRLLLPIARRGPAVVTIDHVTKNVEQRGKGGVGAGAKRGMGDGAFLRVEALEPFGRGQTGQLRITADKDRPGQVREHATEGKFLGIITLESDATTGRVKMRFDASTTEMAGPFRPTVIMQRVSDALALLPDGATKSSIESAVVGKAETVRLAVERLQEEGYIELTPGSRSGTLMLRLVRPFNPLELPSAEPEMDAIARRYDRAGESE